MAHVPYLWLPVFRGRQWAYYRRGGTLTRLPAPTDPGFGAAYDAAHAAAEAAHRREPAPLDPPGSMGALIAAYLASAEWRELRPRTQKDYREGLEVLRARYGALPVVTLPRAFVFRLREDYSTAPGRVRPDGTRGPDRATPRRANKLVAILRLLLSWAVDHGWRRDNPALRTGQLRTGPGYRAWTEADVRTFLACDAVAEPLKRALVLGLYTGQRKADCLALTRAARSGGAIELVQAKTGARVWIPEHPELTRWLSAAPPSDAVTILTRADGKPWGHDNFNHRFAEAVAAAGLTGLSFHGLRKAAAARLAEAGASAHEIMSITGHRTVAEVTRYTEAADQRGRATAAIAKLRRHSRGKSRGRSRSD